jgi:hypothetical protein
VAADVAVAEDGIAGDKDFRACLDDVGDGFEVDSTIHFNAEIEFALRAHAGERGDFVQRVGNEFLAPKTGIDAHHQNVMDEVEDFRKRFDRRGGIENYAWLAAVRSNEVKRAVEMYASFLMDRDPVGARFSKFRDEVIGMLDHEMAIKRNLEVFAQTGDHNRADSEVGNEVAVHDVEMEDGAAAFDGLLGVSGKLREIGGENGRRKFDIHGMAGTPFPRKLYAGGGFRSGLAFTLIGSKRFWTRFFV